MMIFLTILLLVSLSSGVSAQLGKSTNGGNPVTTYAARYSGNLTAAQIALAEDTRTMFGDAMMGAPEVIAVNQLLMRAINAKNVLDVGTFTGFSAMAAALVIPQDGQVITMDVTDQFFNPSGRVRSREAGVDNKIRLVVRPALETLDELVANGTAGEWDFCFIDADKVNYDAYYERCLQLLRKGGMITVDNALWGGSVTGNPTTMDRSTRALHELNVKISGDSRVMNSLLPFADGLNVVLKL